MNTVSIIREAEADGVKLTLSPVGTIKAVGSADAVKRWVPVILENKPSIVAALQRAAPRPDARAELLGLVDTVADFHGFSPEERAEAKENALKDFDAAMMCFRGLVADLPLSNPTSGGNHRRSGSGPKSGIEGTT